MIPKILIPILLILFLFGCTERYVEESPSLEFQTEQNECSYNIYNCPDFNSQEEAQKIFNLCEIDVHDLDRDNDEVACE